MFGEILIISMYNYIYMYIYRYTHYFFAAYLASFNNFLKHIDGNESDESAESEKPKPNPKPKARDTNKFGQVQNLILGAPIKKRKPAPEPLSEEEQFKIAVAKAKGNGLNTLLRFKHDS